MSFMPLVVASMLGTLLHAQDGPVGFASLEGSGDKRVAGGTAGGMRNGVGVIA